MSSVMPEGTSAHLMLIMERTTFYGMQMLDIDAWSRRVQGIVGLDEMHNAVRAFERNVHWAVQNEGRIRQPSRSKVSWDSGQ